MHHPKRMMRRHRPRSMRLSEAALRLRIAVPLQGKRRLRWVSADGGASESGGEPSGDRESASRSATKSSTHLRQFVRAVREGDEATVEDVVLRLSRSRRAFAPHALVVGGFVLLFDGLKLLFTTWRL